MAHIGIIGGGVIGLATAWALVRDGHSVTVLEAREHVGTETSFANGGQLSYRYVAPLADAGVPLKALGWLGRDDAPLRLQPRLDPAQWRWLASFLLACRGSVNRRNGAHLLRLALQSQATLAQWMADDELGDFGWRRNGKLVTFRDRAGFEHAARHLADASAQHVLSADDCLRTEPALPGGAFVGGIHTPDEEVADCHAFCQRLAEKLRASNRCTLLTDRRVASIVHKGDTAHGVIVDGDFLPFDHVVIAAGHRSGELGLPGIRLPLYPLKGYSLTLPVGPGHTPPETSITDYDRKIVYARIGCQLRIAAMVDIVGFDAAPDPKRLAVLRAQARESFPDAGDHDAAIEWAGMRPATPTGVPLIGATPYRNVWLNIGHGALGFTLACGSGQILSELIDRRAPAIDLTGFGLTAA
ncbi:D-amino acid dehydrogenase [Jeongeupia naejangsanensis]|uniref:D-amino acid dehydrogenase n=1 Tax=Jeongeupia naejangsanensis TaxID=613195 RepID=A0ABS2BLI0_9NEIS|nr:D-amino acid dehydrogenase [Jeongeupia naejangsanensis]MBM3116472.1 D-amino acid dehydrogenase [Jeongeupia naejangsanensis]